jgi:hypothetical protein
MESGVARGGVGELAQPAPTTLVRRVRPMIEVSMVRSAFEGSIFIKKIRLKMKMGSKSSLNRNCLKITVKRIISLFQVK